jgi:hypothetical protein
VFAGPVEGKGRLGVMLMEHGTKLEAREHWAKTRRHFVGLGSQSGMQAGGSNPWRRHSPLEEAGGNQDGS